jgi:hypothetical protein
LRVEALKIVKRGSELSWVQVRTILGAGSREGDDWRYSPTSARREDFEDGKELENHCWLKAPALK